MECAGPCFVCLIILSIDTVMLCSNACDLRIVSFCQSPHWEWEQNVVVRIGSDGMKM